MSSTKLKRVARDFGQRGAVNGHYVLFKIDNSTESFWQPRDVVSYSAFPSEGELLYPVGAEFEVQKIALRVKRMMGTIPTQKST